MQAHFPLYVDTKLHTLLLYLFLLYCIIVILANILKSSYIHSLTKPFFFFRWHFVLHVCFASFSKCLRSCIFHPSLVCVGGKREGLIQVAWGTGTWGTYGTFSHAMGSESAWASWCSQWCGGRGHPIVRGQEGLTVSLIGTHAQEMIRSYYCLHNNNSLATLANIQLA